MRTYIGTEVTLDTVIRIPYRNINCDTALLICGGTGWCRTVNVINESGYRQVVAFLSVNSSLNRINELDNVFSSLCSVSHLKTFVLCCLPALRNLNLYDILSACIDSCPVLLNDILTLTAVSCLSGCLHQFDCSLLRNNRCKFEECGLKDCIDTCRAHAGLNTKLHTIDGVEFDVVICDELLNLSR